MAHTAVCQQLSYKTGDHYYACATSPGGRSATWKALGRVNVMEARRLRDKFSAEIQGAPAPPIAASRRLTFGELADEWLGVQATRVVKGQMSPRTF
jgi:hypothetical protein